MANTMHSSPVVHHPLPPDPDLAGAELVLRYGLAMLLTITGIIYAPSGHPELAELAINGALAVVGVALLTRTTRPAP